MPKEDFVLLTGTANIPLAKKVASILKKPIHPSVTQFADGEKRVVIPENLRRKQVFIIQPTCPPVDSNIMELLLLIDASRRASASEITAVVPYFGYSRQDRKEKPRVPISAALVADLIEHAGADRIVTIDIHSQTEQGFVKHAWDNLFASYSFLPILKKKFSKNLIVASPDKNGVAMATFYAQKLHADGLAIVYKERDIQTENISKALGIIGEVLGKDVLLVDDMIDAAGTITNAANLINEKGAKSIKAVVTHGLFSQPARERIEESVLEEIYVTDSVPLKEEMKNTGKIKVVSVADLLAKAIKCIYTGQSISKKLYP
jgi:ribose-phosphate pyrophosphokinase